MGATTRQRLRPAGRLARQVFLPPLLITVAVVSMLTAIALSLGQAKSSNPLAKSEQEKITHELSADLEGTPNAADIARARRPASERRKLLEAHPYYALYSAAKQHFDVSMYLVASVHYQETGFGKAPGWVATKSAWKVHRDASLGLPRPATYPHRTGGHPTVNDDFDVVMAIGSELRDGGSIDLGPAAKRAIEARYGSSPDGRLASAMVIERARAWRLLGYLPMPGSGELAMPVKGVVGGCGYFGCPRPGHLHNGVDFLAPMGTPIHAADTGRVAVVQSPGASGGYGNFVCVQHRARLASCYAHMSTFAANVRVGAHVRRGQVLGLVGSTGSSSAPHLHFEVRRGDASCSACAVDPLPLLSGDVPDAHLPKMTDAAPSTIRAASAVPVAVAQAPAAAPPAATTQAPRAADPQADTEPADTADEAGEPAAATTLRNRPTTTTGDSTTGGAVHRLPAPPTVVPNPAPATAPVQQQPAAVPADTGTGGIAPSDAPAETGAPAAAGSGSGSGAPAAAPAGS